MGRTPRGYHGTYQKDRNGDKPRRAADHGAPGQAHGEGKGKRDNHRAGHTQIVRTGIFGGTKVVDGRKSGELRDRWRG